MKLVLTKAMLTELGNGFVVRQYELLIVLGERKPF